MPEGPLRGATNFAILDYQVGLEPPFDKSVKEIENIVGGAVEDNIIPDVATRDVESGRVQEKGVPKDEQDLTVIVETTNVSTSNVTLNDIESDINNKLNGTVTMVSVQAKLSGPVDRLISRVMD